MIGLVMGSGVAEARHSYCHEVSQILGYRKCGSFFAWWEVIDGPSAQVEESVAFLRFKPSPFTEVVNLRNGHSYDLASAPADHSAVDAIGVRQGMVLHVLHHLDLGFEVGYSHVLDGPRIVVSDSSALGTPVGAPSQGSIMSGLVFVGARELVGNFALSAQLAAQARVTSLGPTAPRSDVGADLFDDDLLVRTKVELWESRWVTFAATGSVDLFDRRDLSLALGFAFHIEPYDGMR
jgi:hypothetical protein